MKFKPELNVEQEYLEDLFVGVEDLHISKGSEIAFIKQLKKGYFILGSIQNTSQII